MHKMYVKQIIEKSSKEDMEKLEEIFDEAVDHIKECDHEMYKELEMELYTIVNGKKFTEDMARDIINAMRPVGMKFSLEDSKSIQSQYGLTSIDPIEFWIVINSGANDYKDILDDNMEMYARFTKDFINDEDAPKNKVWDYFVCMYNK